MVRRWRAEPLPDAPGSSRHGEPPVPAPWAERVRALCSASRECL